MKKQEKAFTLIELLAVILILGIIALIAIPTVNSVLDDARRGAFKSTLNNLSKKVEETCSMELIKGKSITKNYYINEGVITPKLEIKGDLPDGLLTVDNDCNVTYELANNSYVGILNDSEEEVSINKCTDNCLKYSESILNGAKPNLDSGMIPVTIDTDGTVKKADIYSEWYSYENKEWANMVLVTDSTRETYKEAKAETTITSTDILGYFVWVPRYKYKIPTSGTTTPSTIDIVFENNSTTKSVGDAKTEYLTAPGFTFGTVELNGIWVAKFETTGSAEAPTILPNVYSLRNQNINNQFATALKFNDYGTTSDAHMMKNTEWATAAYLSHSKYGINTEIRINNNTEFKTGCGASTDNAASSSECQIVYGSTENLPQSTTGNITGIFDMSGGVWERVMGNYNNIIASSGFDTMPNKVDYDFYQSTDFTKACNGKNCLGHALVETKNWYSDYYNSLSSSTPWFSRGGSYYDISCAGAFYMSDSDGGAGSFNSFRVVVGV